MCNVPSSSSSVYYWGHSRCLRTTVQQLTPIPTPIPTPTSLATVCQEFNMMSQGVLRLGFLVCVMSLKIFICLLRGPFSVSQGGAVGTDCTCTKTPRVRISTTQTCLCNVRLDLRQFITGAILGVSEQHHSERCSWNRLYLYQDTRSSQVRISSTTPTCLCT